MPAKAGIQMTAMISGFRLPDQSLPGLDPGSGTGYAGMTQSPRPLAPKLS
jgi:hypothetical protein